MASEAQTAKKTAIAVQTIETASTALAAKFNLDVTGLPNIGRMDPAHGRAVQLEYLGDLLTRIADATGAEAAPKAESLEEVLEDAPEEVVEVPEEITGDGTGEALPPADDTERVSLPDVETKKRKK